MFLFSFCFRFLLLLFGLRCFHDLFAHPPPISVCLFVSLWLPFKCLASTSTRLPLGSFWFPFGSHWDPFGSFFGSFDFFRRCRNRREAPSLPFPLRTRGGVWGVSRGVRTEVPVHWNRSIFLFFLLKTGKRSQWVPGASLVCRRHFFTT